MKKTIYVIIAFAALFWSGANAQNRYEGSVIFNNGTLKEVGDSLRFSIDIFVNNQAVIPQAGIRFIPVVVSGDNTMELPDLMVQGSGKNKSWERSYAKLIKRERVVFKEPYKMLIVSKDENTAFHYTYIVPYEMWMDEARLVIYQELIGYNDKRSYVAMSFDNKVQLSPRTPYVPQPLANFITPQPEAKLRNSQGQAFLDFQTGRSKIIPTFRRNPEELAKIRAVFSELSSNPDIEVKGIFIEGYASPEGRYESNEILSRDRAIALKNYILANSSMKLSDNQTRVSWIAEDWDGTAQMVRTSDIDHKDEILSIIENTENPDAREAKIKTVGRGIPYRKMLNDMFPQLRRVEYQVDYTVKDFSTEEILTKNEADYKLLSQLELYTLAAKVSDTLQYEKIMVDVIPVLYPNNPTAAANAAGVLIRNGEYALARKMLENFEDNPLVWNNLGVVYMMSNDLNSAEAMFIKARQAGVKEAEHNIDEVEAKRIDNAKMERYRQRDALENR